MSQVFHPTFRQQYRRHLLGTTCLSNPSFYLQYAASADDEMTRLREGWFAAGMARGQLADRIAVVEAGAPGGLR